MYYLIDGRVKNDPEDSLFYIEEGLGVYSFPGDNVLYDLDAACVHLYDVVLTKLFNDVDKYYEMIRVRPMWIASAGHNSDFGMSRIDFEQVLRENTNETLHRLLFLEDCNTLIGYLQNRIVESRNKLVQFYLLLAQHQPITLVDGISWETGENTTVIFSLLNDIIINFYALLDLTTKVCFELENIPSNFDNYPKQASLKILYGNKDRINLDTSGTIFEASTNVKLIETLRHELIHNGYWEATPKLFIHIENSLIQEKWIHMMDEINGILVTYKNRKRFFSEGHKINERLPLICAEFWSRLLTTIIRLGEV